MWGNPVPQLGPPREDKVATKDLTRDTGSLGTVTKNNPKADCALERARAHSQEMENNLQLQQKICEPGCRVSRENNDPSPRGQALSPGLPRAHGHGPSPVLLASQGEPGGHLRDHLGHRGAELGYNTDLPGTQIPSAEAGRNATLSLPRHGHGARRPLSSRTGEHGSRGARKRALLVSPRGRKTWGSPNVALGHPAGAAAALSQREWVHGATALIWQRLPPTLYSRTRCRATGRGAPQNPRSGPGLRTVASSHARGAKAAPRGAGGQDTSLCPGRAPAPRLGVDGQGWRQRLPKGCELNLVWFVR